MADTLLEHLSIEVKTSRSGDFTLSQRDIDGVLPDGHVAFLVESRLLRGPRWILVPARLLSPGAHEARTLVKLADTRPAVDVVVDALNTRWSDWILDGAVRDLLFQQDAMKFKDAMRWCLKHHAARRSGFSGAIREGKVAAALAAFRDALDVYATGSSGPQIEGYVHQYILEDAFGSLGYHVTNNPIGVPDFDARLERVPEMEEEASSTPKNGIFCLEGDWEADLRDPTSVEPILQLLKDVEGIPYVHRQVATREQLGYYVDRWQQYSSHPILYLAFHGVEGYIDLTKESGDDSYVSLVALSDVLEGKCEGQLVHFSSCYTLQVSREELQVFMTRTKAAATCGYLNKVDFVESSALELLWLTEVQKAGISADSLTAAHDRLKELMPGLVQKLGFELALGE